MSKRSPDEMPELKTDYAKEVKLLREELRIAEQKIYSLTELDQRYSIKTGRRKTFKIAASSDWHIGSLYSNPDALIEFHRYAYDQGCRHFVCAGDLIEGENNYKGQIYEVRDVGVTKQVNALRDVVAQFPALAKTIFITGNHCGGYAKEIGLDIGEYIEMKCAGLEYIGRDLGLIEIDTPSGDVRIALMHPDGGTAYAISYRIQKIVEQWEGGEKPHMLLVGHFHKAEVLPRIRNVSAIQAGTFQRQTPFMKRKSSAAHVGGWIIEFEMGELYNRIKTEFVSFF